jgi:hypothetical protein
MEVPAETYLSALGSGLRGSALLELGIARSDPGRYVLDLFDVRGRRVARLVEGALTPGRYRIPLGSGLAAGVYFARMEGPGEAITKKVVVLR